MPTFVLDLAVGALAAAVLLGGLRTGLAVLVASAVLVPDTLVVANPVSNYATVTRVLLVLYVIRLALAWRAKQLPRGLLRWTPVHSAIAALLVCVFVAGVLLARATTPSFLMIGPSIDYAEQIVFFVVVLAGVRAINDLRWVLGAVSVVLLLSAGIGVVEHITGGSWGHWLFANRHTSSVAANPLEVRESKVRVRAGAEYALQYGWVTAMLLPALLAWLGTWRQPLRRWLPVTLVVVGFVLLAQYWSYSRTALGALGGIVLITAFAARNRRLVGFTAAGVAIAAGTFSAVNAVQAGFVGLPSGYVSVRTERLPGILQLVAVHPLHGLGIGGLTSFGVVSTDSSYLQIYADAGLLAVAAAVLLFATCAFWCLPGLRSPDPVLRISAAAALAATAAMAAGGFAYDSLRSLSSARPFYLLVAVGIVAAERARGPLPRLSLPRPLPFVAAVGAAALVGVAVFALAPVHYARQYQFRTVSAAREAAPLDPITLGQTLINTVCGTVAHGGPAPASAHLECRNLHSGAGVGSLRVQAPTRSGVDAGVAHVTRLVAATPVAGFDLLPETGVQRGRDTVAAWTWVWLPVTVAGMMLLLPIAPRRRHGADLQV